jgi:hypothetical protein
MIIEHNIDILEDGEIGQRVKSVSVENGKIIDSSCYFEFNKVLLN